MDKLNKQIIIIISDFSLDSDHLPVSLTMKTEKNLEKKIKKVKSYRIVWDDKYKQEMNRELEKIINTPTKSLSIHEIDNTFVSSLQKTIKRVGMFQLVPKILGEKTWFNDECVAAKQEVKKAYRDLKSSNYSSIY